VKFVDQVRIEVKAGDGGHGAVAFRREKFIDKGGPSGGDGGHGGSVIFTADPQLTTLLDYRYQQHHHAESGEHGMGSDCNGKNGVDMHLKVPVGTIFSDYDTGEVLAELDTAGASFVAAKGGRGGLGNINFATSTRQTPRFAQDGTTGELKTITLELKLLADAGLVGFPNAGKSTFIARVSRARPKIADYPFTTLVPNLGVVQYKGDRSFVMADIPGLIEGASEGVGLGHQFLRHVERCRVLVHLVDLSAGIEGRDPVEDFDALNRELEKYSPALAEKPQIVVANKLDLPFAREALPAFEEAMQKRGLRVFELSGVTGDGLNQVLDQVARVLFAEKSTKVRLKGRHELRALFTAHEALEAAGPAKKVAVTKKKVVKAAPAPKKKPAKKAPPAEGKVSRRGPAKSRKYAREGARSRAR
jgi:GTP-binding protein